MSRRYYKVGIREQRFDAVTVYAASAEEAEDIAYNAVNDSDYIWTDDEPIYDCHAEEMDPSCDEFRYLCLLNCKDVDEEEQSRILDANELVYEDEE